MANNTNVFELSWVWYEDHVHWLFLHEDKTEIQFTKDVKTLLIKYADDILKKNKNSWIGALDWIRHIADKMPELGYKIVKPKQFSFFGGYILRGDDNSDDEWFKIVGDELKERVIEHNKRIEGELGIPL